MTRLPQLRPTPSSAAADIMRHGWAFWELRIEPLTSSLSDSSPQTSSVAQSSTESLRFHSGSTCWKATNAFSPLGSTSALGLLPLKIALHRSLAETTLCHISLAPKWFNVQLSLKKGERFCFDTLRTHLSHFPTLYLPVSFCLFICLLFFFSLWVSFSPISASVQATFAKNSK